MITQLTTEKQDEMKHKDWCVDEAIDDMITQLELNLNELCVPFGAGLALRCAMQGVCFAVLLGLPTHVCRYKNNIARFSRFEQSACVLLIHVVVHWILIC